MSTPIVLIHGFPMDGGMWAEQVAFLGQRGYRVITPDLPGFGNSQPWDRERCSMEVFAEEINQIIQREAGGKAVVGGFSMGGYVLLALLRAHPEAVAGVMLLNTRAEADTIEVRANRLKSMDEVRDKGTGPLVDAMQGRLLSRHAGARVREQAQKIMLRQSAAGIMAAQYAMARRRDQTDVLAEIKVPTLIVVGAEDVVTPPSVALSMHQLVPGSMLVQISHAGHLANMEAPESVNVALETFLRTVHA